MALEPIKPDEAAIENALESDSFGDRCWLTFYLEGIPRAHSDMRESLAKIGGRNLSGGESGTVYAKVPTSLNCTRIESLIARVQDLCLAHGVSIGVIDLDSSADVEESDFVTLWHN